MRLKKSQIIVLSSNANPALTVTVNANNAHIRIICLLTLDPNKSSGILSIMNYRENLDCSLILEIAFLNAP